MGKREGAPMTTKKEPKPPAGRPPEPLPKLNTTPEKLAKELLKQRPLHNVELEKRRKSS